MLQWIWVWYVNLISSTLNQLWIKSYINIRSLFSWVAEESRTWTYTRWIVDAYKQNRQCSRFCNTLKTCIYNTQYSYIATMDIFVSTFTRLFQGEYSIRTAIIILMCCCAIVPTRHCNVYERILWHIFRNNILISSSLS